MTPPLPNGANGSNVASMEVAESVQCPFCGQAFELVIDTSLPSQRFTTDCEVCCRPFEVVADCEPGEILGLDVLQ
jgi:Cysteine-rich CPXCG